MISQYNCVLACQHPGSQSRPRLLEPISQHTHCEPASPSAAADAPVPEVQLRVAWPCQFVISFPPTASHFQTSLHLIACLSHLMTPLNDLIALLLLLHSNKCLVSHTQVGIDFAVFSVRCSVLSVCFKVIWNYSKKKMYFLLSKLLALPVLHGQRALDQIAHIHALCFRHAGLVTSMSVK